MDFMKALEDKRFDDAREISTPETVKLVNLWESISKLSNDSMPMGGSQIEIIDEKIEGDTATVQFVVEGNDFPSTIKLVKSNGSWLVHFTKQDAAMKDSGFQEEEEEGFYEDDNYMDLSEDSLMDLDSTANFE